MQSCVRMNAGKFYTRITRTDLLKISLFCDELENVFKMIQIKTMISRFREESTHF